MVFLKELAELIKVVLALLSLLIVLAEMLHEDEEKAGEKKKKQVLEWWKQIVEGIRGYVAGRFGERGIKILDWLGQEKVASLLVDIIVFVFNAKQIFFKKA